MPCGTRHCGRAVASLEHMEHSLATVLPWALLLLFIALFRGGAWRAAVPLLEGCAAPGPMPGEIERAAQPAQPQEESEAKTPRRGLRPPGPLACAVLATALVRVGVLLAAGR